MLFFLTNDCPTISGRDKELLDSQRRSHRTRVFHSRKHQIIKDPGRDIVPSKKNKRSSINHAGAAARIESFFYDSHLHNNDCAGADVVQSFDSTNFSKMLAPEIQNSRCNIAGLLPLYTTGFTRLHPTSLPDADTLERRDLHYFTTAVASKLRPYSDGSFFNHIVPVLRHMTNASDYSCSLSSPT